MKAQVLELAKLLISRESITPNDAGCQEIIANRLSQLGFQIEHLRFSDVDNLFASLGNANPRLLFAGHTDVVPTGSLKRWRTPPFEPTIRDDCLYGRGAADMKTSLAAMLVATETFIRDFGASLQGGIAFLITSDEEGVATHGTKAVMEWLDERDQTFDYAIVGEPSSHEKLGDVIRVGRRGSLNGTIKLDGAIGHVAYADDTPNPIHSIISALSPLVERQWDEGNEMFIPTTFQISNIHAGTGAENVIPAEVDVKFNFRFNTEHTPEQLQTDVENALEAINHTIDTRVEWRLSGSPFLSKQGNLTDTVADQIQKHTGLIPQKSTSGGTSDARFLVPKGIETVELGPVNRSIHKFDEHVAVKEFEPLARIYHDTLVALLT